MSNASKSKRRAFSVVQDNPSSEEPASKRRASGKHDKSFSDNTNTTSCVNIFTTILSEAGFKFDVHGNKISIDSVRFKQRFQRILCERDCLSEGKPQFTEAIRKTFDSEAEFLASLFPTELCFSDCDTDMSSTAEIIQDSLIKIMLECEEVQPCIIEMLTNKLPMYSDNENVTVDLSPTVRGDTDTANIPRLILNQLRWLDFIQSSTSLATKLLQMASIMKPAVSCDIISFIPDLLSDDVDHSVVAASLCELLDNGPDNITSAVFDALSNLVLGSSVTKDVQGLAISKLSSGSLCDLPVIVKFLLKSCSSVDVANEVIQNMRLPLDFAVFLESDEPETTVKSSTLVLADVIFSAMQFQPFIAQSWIAVLEKVAPNEHTVGDVVQLLFLCSVHQTQQQKAAVSFFNSNIKKNLIPLPLLKQSFEKCSYLLAPHFRSVCSIAKTMLWQHDSNLSSVGALLYELFLLHMDSFCKQEAIGLLVEHVSAVSSGAGGEADTALGVLCRVAQNSPVVLTPYTNYLRDALDRMDLMTLPQVRQSYTVLSCLAFNPSDDVVTLSMRDEIHMMLQKQLAHASDRYRHIGIIGSVTALLALSRMNADGSFDCAAEMKSLLQNLNYVLRSNLVGWSLFYDEIHVTFGGCAKIPDSLLKKLSGDARTKLHEQFLGNVNHPPATSTSARLDHCFRLGLLADEELKENAVAVLPHGSNCVGSKQLAPSLLCSLFRAIATLERISKGSLGEIDALLCCPLYIHSAKYEDKSALLELPDDHVISVLDTMFVTANWFRELLSVFSPETDEDIEVSVLSRLKAVCEIQTTIETLLRYAPSGYLPPLLSPSVTEAAVSKMKASGSSGGSGKGAKNLDKSISPSAAPSKQTKEKKAAGSSPQFDPSTLRHHLREMSFDVLRLLRYPVHFNESGDDDDADPHLLPKHLDFLIQDLKMKVTHRLTSSKLPAGFGRHSKSDASFEKINRMPPKEVAQRTIDLIPHLCRHLNDVIENLNNASSKPEDPDASMVSDTSGLFIRQHEVSSHCLELTLETLLCLTSWLKSSGNESLVTTFLTQTANGARKRTGSNDQAGALSSSFRYLASLAPAVSSSAAAHALLKIMVALRELAAGRKSQQSWMAKKISSVANEFLLRDWSDCTFVDKPIKVNVILSGVFASHLKHNDDPLGCVETFLQNSLSQLLTSRSQDDGDEEGDQVNYPLLTKSNFYVFYKVMLEVLSEEASSIKPPSNANTSRTAIQNVDLLLQWSEVVKVLDLLIRVLKSFPSRTTVSPALKYAKSIVESFIRTGIPACEVTFREHQDDVISLLKKIQGSTRQLQHLTCHSKVLKDSSLTNHVPALKRCLETFVFRVKALLVLHNCHEAFWLGNLKNRNLQGEEILSQAPATQSSSEDENENDDAPEEGERNESGRSYSESY